jgi:hypothetical protein
MSSPESNTPPQRRIETWTRIEAWTPASQPPAGTPGRWSRDVVVYTSHARIFDHCAFCHSTDGSEGIWRRLPEFKKDEVVVCWIDVPNGYFHLPTVGEIPRNQRIILGGAMGGNYMLGMAGTEFEKVDEDCAMDNARIPRHYQNLSLNDRARLTWYLSDGKAGKPPFQVGELGSLTITRGVDG